MSNASAFGFGKFIPGFDFLHNLGKAGQGAGGMPPFSNWVAPTVSVEEIEKRIQELQAVQFWLEQNSRALAATLQALEVQKMTLSTLKGMNVNLTEWAQAFPFTAPQAAEAPAPEASPGDLSDWPLSGHSAKPAAAAPASPPEPEPAVQAPSEAADAQAQPAPGASMAQALQWWGALTQQFQHIAQQALQDPLQQQALHQATQMGSEFAQTAVKTASEMVRQAVASVPPKTESPAKARKPSASSAKAAAPRRASAKKAAPADKKPGSRASKTSGAAAKKPSVGKAKKR